MNDSISRQAALDTISILSELRSNYNCFDKLDEPYYQALTEAIAAVKAERKGHWIEQKLQNSPGCRLIECSECGDGYIVEIDLPLEDWADGRNYCVRCGARMAD